MKEITPIAQSAPFIAETVEKVNELVKAVNPLINIEAGPGIEITQGGESKNVIIKANGDAVSYNLSVLVLDAGELKYIDIPYDSDTGAYPYADGPNFPL